MGLESFLTGFLFIGGGTPRNAQSPAERKFDRFTAILTASLQHGSGLAFFFFLVFFLFLWYNIRKKFSKRKRRGNFKKRKRKGGNKMLSEQAIAARRKYKNEWARNNPEKVKAQQERYWQKRAAQQAQEPQQAPPAPQVEAEKE